MSRIGWDYCLCGHHRQYHGSGYKDERGGWVGGECRSGAFGGGGEERCSCPTYAEAPMAPLRAEGER